MRFARKALAMLGIVNHFIVFTDAHSFWVNVDKETGTVEVTFSEQAGVPDKAIQHLKEKINDSFRLNAMIFGGGLRQGPQRLSIDWSLGEESITGTLPTEVMNSDSSAVAGRMDFGPFDEYGIDVDDLVMQFSSSQLIGRRDKLHVAAHQQMHEKPFYMGLDGCNSEIVATIHGISSSIDEDPLSVCIFKLGGEKIDCKDAEQASEGDDSAVARFTTSMDTKTTIFAKTDATFPSSGEKGIRKHSTVSATYTPQCII
mmetsp:Transcript_12687/g.16021  ORF Transcript_12687/g.16021 Transcript_12687/m.16021 type:complete len:257 (-) Transcript_12687:86-856(-)|eukprot:CAMPEP_0172501618 /NCGR_PEP_ID=MMETSP1066-20121228/151571_1 /TAXON_ID=671091 /ORGANISM="Coscinodiscus wailesii, Strain CCMP2513" /LENGTH=256 /DNA_ID=CAMNT_0013276515 /DNA_START=25 /DNA_END=795 /DNA_ORIENTATION=-